MAGKKLSRRDRIKKGIRKRLTGSESRPRLSVYRSNKGIYAQIINDDDGGKWIPSDIDYYGEVEFNISYKNEKEEPFDWMYIDYNTLQNAAHANNLQCELILEGEHYDYLAKLSL